MEDSWQKVVGPRAEREAVRVVREEARWVDRDAPWELAVPRDETALRVRLSWRAERPRFGLSATIRYCCDGRRPRTERFDGGQPQESVSPVTGGTMQRRRQKQFRVEARVPLALPTRANEG